MSNHGFINLTPSWKKKINMDLLYSMMQEINRSRFDGKINLKRNHDQDEEWILLEIYKDGGFPFWINEKRNIEIRHSCGGDLAWWIQDCFINDLALKTESKISDEGCDGKWKGEENYTPTLRSHLNKMFARSLEDHPKESEIIIDQTMKESEQFRPDLKEFFG